MLGRYSVIGTDAGHRFSTAVVGLAEIWATSVRRKRRERIASGRGRPLPNLQSTRGCVDPQSLAPSIRRQSAHGLRRNHKRVPVRSIG